MTCRKFNSLQRYRRAQVELHDIRKLLKSFLDDNLMFDYEYENLIDKINGFEFLLGVDFSEYLFSDERDFFNRRFKFDEQGKNT